MPTTKELLSGGGGAPAAAFPTIGTKWGGVITKVPHVSQETDMNTGEPKEWPDGKPKWQIEVTVQTDQRDPEIPDDDGTRRIFVKGRMLSALKEVLREVGVDDVELGGTVWLTYTANQPSKTKGFQAAHLFEAAYTPPGLAPLPAFAADEEPF